jgi:hypothetical protein
VFQLDDWVLCRIHKKSNNFQFGDPEQEEGSSTVEEESLNNNNMNSAASPKSDANDDDHDQLQFQPTTTMTSMSKSYSITDLLNTFDYSALSQLLDEPPLIIYPAAAATPTTQTQHQALDSNNYCNHNDAVMNSSSHFIDLLPRVDACSKRVMTVDGGGAEPPSSSFFDGGSSSSFSTKLLKKLPSDSTRGSSYCNQQQQQQQKLLLADTTSGAFQYSSLLSYPFLEMQMQ